MINRAAIILRYREPAVRWINEADPYEDNPGMTREVVNKERTVYLIRAEDAETSAAVDEWVELNHRLGQPPGWRRGTQLAADITG